LYKNAFVFSFYSVDLYGIFSWLFDMMPCLTQCYNCAREDGKLSCGYSSFRGKRATMEDFFDVKLTEIDGQAVSLFGVFDGMDPNVSLFNL